MHAGCTSLCHVWSLGSVNIDSWVALLPILPLSGRPVADAPFFHSEPVPDEQPERCFTFWRMHNSKGSLRSPETAWIGGYRTPYSVERCLGDGSLGQTRPLESEKGVAGGKRCRCPRLASPTCPLAQMITLLWEELNSRFFFGGCAPKVMGPEVNAPPAFVTKLALGGPGVRWGMLNPHWFRRTLLPCDRVLKH